MTEPIEDAYFGWLAAKVLDYESRISRNPNHWDLLRILHGTEFIWLVQGDHNRADDGRELRVDFIRENEEHYSPDEEPFWFDGPCSVLEMLIAFAKRAEFQTDISPRKWFWQFMENLGLREYRRISDPRQVVEIEEIVNTFVYRTYRPDGDGNILPMKHTERDQRKEEIWTQFFEYLNEQGI